MDRKKIAVSSSIIGLTSRLISVILSFISRKFFLQYLGADLLGVSSTLTQVLETLSLGELGFQTTIIFQLYKPIVEKDHEKVSQILMLLKKIYSYLGIAIFLIGLGVMPFLPKIITRVDVEISLIYIVYMIMLLGTALSYLLSYPRALLQADQKIYINNMIDSLLQIIVTVVRIVCLVVWHSFVVYVLLGLVNNVVGNIVSYLYYRRHYFWINTKAKPDRNIVKILVANTKDIFVGKIAGYVYSSTDNLVISSFVGTRWVGLVVNYSAITNAIKLVIFGITGPIQPMLGNFLVSNKKEDAERTLMNYGFVRFMIALFLLIPTMCLSSMFVDIFYGEEYVLNPVIVILLVLDLLIICLAGAVGEMIEALGYFKQEKPMYIAYAVVNFALSCVGAKLWGIIPVFVATVFTQFMAWIWRSIIAYKYYFESWSKFLGYWCQQFQYLIYFGINSFIVYFLGEVFDFSKSYVGFCLYGIISECMILMIFLIVFRKKSEFKYVKTLLNKIR